MEIIPFKGYRYDPEVVGDAGACVTPPYDVIDREMQDRFYDRSPYNIVRIIRGRSEEGDDSSNNVYTRAGEFFSQLLDCGAVRQDSDESLYAYVQDFELNGERYRRSGFTALGRLEEFGGSVRPHEKTLDGPKADRLNLTRATGTQFGQIFMIYDDPEMVADEILREAASETALIDFSDSQNVRHRLFAITAPEAIGRVAAMMRDKQAVIADGHHRYETALNYYRETKLAPAGYALMTFVNMRNPGMIILPTHRLVSRLERFNIAELIGKLHADFEMTHYDFADEAGKRRACERMFGDMKTDFAAGRHAFGLYAADGHFYRAVLRDAGCMNRFADLSPAARALDVNVLHRVILEGHLGIGEKQLAAESNIEYIKDIGDAIERSVAAVDEGAAQAVFFMNPTRIEQVSAIAEAGEKMPQKSTFFYPKIFTGLVMNRVTQGTACPARNVNP